MEQAKAEAEKRQKQENRLAREQSCRDEKLRGEIRKKIDQYLEIVLSNVRYSVEDDYKHQASKIALGIDHQGLSKKEVLLNAYHQIWEETNMNPPRLEDCFKQYKYQNIRVSVYDRGITEHTRFHVVDHLTSPKRTDRLT